MREERGEAFTPTYYPSHQPHYGNGERVGGRGGMSTMGGGSCDAEVTPGGDVMGNIMPLPGRMGGTLAAVSGSIRRDWLTPNYKHRKIWSKYKMFL